jgi:hypothetical protein
MLEKKLVTVACAAGVLGCGACFLPPLPQHKPPPPPLRIDFGEIRNIRVEVTNASVTHRIEGARLAEEVADEINAQPRISRVSAHVGNGVEPDAVLRIVVVSESVKEDDPAMANPRSVTFFLKDSASLTNRDGGVVWQETEAGSRITRVVDGHAEGGKDLTQTEMDQLDKLDKDLSNRIVFRMFYVR